MGGTMNNEELREQLTILNCEFRTYMADSQSSLDTLERENAKLQYENDVLKRNYHELMKELQEIEVKLNSKISMKELENRLGGM